MQHQSIAKRAAIYCRVSTDKQERDGSSLETQQERGAAYAESHGYTLAPEHIYRDATSGYTLDRPALRALQDAARVRAFDVVIIKEVGRLSRSQANTHIILARLKAHSVRVEFTDSTFETNAIGTFMLSAEAFVAEFWREQHAERTTTGRHARAKSGKLLPGKRPAYGYQWRAPVSSDAKPHTAYDLDPRTAPIVQRMYQIMADGGSLSGVKRALEAEGIPAPAGGHHWSQGVIRNMLQNERYKGEATMCRTVSVRTPAGTRATPLRPEAERIRLPAGTVPALVSAELWERATVQIAAGSRNNPRRLPDPDHYLLRGFVRCEHCDKRLGTMRRQRGDVYRSNPMNVREHGCPNRQIVSATLDAEVWELIEQIIKHPDRIIDKIVADFTSDTDPTQEERNAITRALRDTERAQRMQALAIEALDSPEAAAPNVARLRQLAKERASLTAQLAELDQRRAGWKSGLAAAARLTEAFQTEQERLDNLTMDERRAILNWLGVAVTLHAGDATPRWTMTTRIKLPRWLEPEPAIDDTGAPVVPGQRYRTGGGFPEADHPEFTAILRQLAGGAGADQSFPTGCSRSGQPSALTSFQAERSGVEGSLRRSEYGSMAVATGDASGR